MVEELLTGLGAGGILAGSLAVLAAFGLMVLLLYIYSSWALMVIAQKTKTDMPWLAWIPIANIYLMTQIAKVPWWWLVVLLLVGFVPIIGQLASVAIFAWLWWQIAENRNMPGWYGILMIIPVVQLIMIGIIAWSK